jgi:PAS domain S-box-containing protein
VISRRLNRPDGGFAGIVIVTVDPAYFADFYRESTLGRQGMLAMLSMDGVYRVRRMGDRVDAAFDGSTTPLFAAAMSNDAGSYIRDSVIDHTRRLLAYRRLAGYPLIVAVARAEDEVLADFTQRRVVYLATGAVATAIMVIFFAANTLLAFRSHRSAREARRQKSFLQALVDNLPMSVMVRSMKIAERGRVILWNPAAEFIFGVPANEALGKYIRDFFPPDRAAAVEERDRALLDSPMVQEVPRLVIDVPQRGRRLCRVVRVPVFDVDDQVEYIISITHDITEQQARADELRLISTVFETTADAIVLSDAEDRVIAVNAAFTRVTGFEAGEMLGKLLTESPFAPSDPVQYAARQEQMAASAFHPIPIEVQKPAA